MFCERVILCIRIIPGANVFVNAIGKEKKDGSVLGGALAGSGCGAETVFYRHWRGM